MEEDLIQIFELLVALVAAIIAYWQHQKKTRAENRTSEVIAFFDPGDDSVTTPPAPIPSRTWMMNEETLRWLVAGHDATNQGALLRQVEDAEREHRSHYYLTFSDRGGGFYEIEYGLIKGSGSGNPG